MHKSNVAHLLRYIIWLGSIAIVAMPLSNVRDSHGDIVYMVASTLVLLAGFIAGLAISYHLNK